MNIKTLLVSSLIVTSLNSAEDFNSEFSHFVGGALLAGGATAIVDHYYPEDRSDRGTIGFVISTAAVLVDQSIQYAEYGNIRGQLLDTAAHIAGSALGAFITDEYFLSPVIQNSKSEGEYIGVSLRHAF
ncbi:MAG: hypothetical protein JZU62_04535 [Sulfuricurvum sp.]|uniref:hypothetical protein n=1 Tax=Sulfuricurvum sp. TaxID=2025608 RepID=UPI0025D35E81|nr:hypothetical protein [Sulfuricurvum sp.]MBV5320931.1 hypothetical protein [Sulfuricurvum sp.]